MPHRPIGIFDSGLGGISVLKEIHKQLPNEDLIYIADSAHAPYGDKDKSSILKRCRTVTKFLLEQDIKVLVIACNTATAIAADILREEFKQFEIIALEPAVKPAAEITKTGVIGILATDQTIRSQRLEGLIEEYAKEIKTEKRACVGLVEQVEAGHFSSKKTQQLLDNYISPMLDKGVDTLVLGCTHYPFLMNSIRKLTNNSIVILETSIPVTQQLSRVLSANILQANNSIGSILFYSSEKSEEHKNGIKRLWGGNLSLTKLPESFC